MTAGRPHNGRAKDDHALVGFETARLRLRPLEASDAALYCSLYGDPGMMEHIAPPMSHERALRSFASVLERQGSHGSIWVISERGSLTAHGILGVFPGDRDAEVGVMLLPEGQARGFAAEAIGAIARHLFLESGLERIWTRHARGNRAARALMEKMGFEPCDANGQADGKVRWQLSRPAWTVATWAVAVAGARG